MTNDHLRKEPNPSVYNVKGFFSQVKLGENYSLEILSSLLRVISRTSLHEVRGEECVA